MAPKGAIFVFVFCESCVILLWFFWVVFFGGFVGLCVGVWFGCGGV